MHIRKLCGTHLSFGFVNVERGEVFSRTDQVDETPDGQCLTDEWKSNTGNPDCLSAKTGTHAPRRGEEVKNLPTVSLVLCILICKRLTISVSRSPDILSKMLDAACSDVTLTIRAKGPVSSVRTISTGAYANLVHADVKVT